MYRMPGRDIGLCIRFRPVTFDRGDSFVISIEITTGCSASDFPDSVYAKKQMISAMTASGRRVKMPVFESVFFFFAFLSRP